MAFGSQAVAGVLSRTVLGIVIFGLFVSISQRIRKAGSSS